LELLEHDNIFTFSLKALVEKYKRLRALLIALYDARKP